jgi:hypothetical protein
MPRDDDEEPPPHNRQDAGREIRDIFLDVEQDERSALIKHLKIAMKIRETADNQDPPSRGKKFEHWAATSNPHRKINKKQALKYYNMGVLEIVDLVIKTADSKKQYPRWDLCWAWAQLDFPHFPARMFGSSDGPEYVF